MTTINASRIIPFPKQKVWKVLADFGNIQNFNPAVIKSFSHEGPATGLGAKRHCDLAPFGSVDEEITEWEEGTRLKAYIYEGKKMPPIKNMYGTFHLMEVDGGTEVHFEIEYKMKLGLLGDMMNGMMMQSQYTKKSPVTKWMAFLIPYSIDWEIPK